MTPLLSDKSRILSTLPLALRELFPRAAVYSHVINSLPLYEDTARAIEKHWQRSSSELNRLAIRSCPSYIGNLLLSASCLKRLGRDLLLQTPGFYFFDYTGQPCSCFEWRDDCVCNLESWRIDIDPKHAERGFILPVRHPKYLFFEALRVFRHPRDAHGFLLKLRTEEKEKAA